MTRIINNKYDYQVLHMLKLSSYIFYSIILSIIIYPNSALSHLAPLVEPEYGQQIISLSLIIILSGFGFCAGICMLYMLKKSAYLVNLLLISFILFESYHHLRNESLLLHIEFITLSLLFFLLTWQFVYFLSRLILNNRLILSKFFYVILEKLDIFFAFTKVKAHCDIPCKIYDPHIAIVSALTIVRLIDIIEETKKNNNIDDLNLQNTLIRCVERKEFESEKVKAEIRVIWGDYFKDVQLEAYPDTHNIVHCIMMLSSKTKQTIDRKVALELVDEINKFASIFWSTKDVETEKVISPYPPSIEIIRPKL